jgi:hypothetical protein
MPHDQGFECELRECVCHLLVTDFFEEQVDLISGDVGCLMIILYSKSTAEM